MGKGEGKGAEAKGFDEATLETYKECFKLMDIDKDGVINKNDLRAAFDNVGSLMSEQELDSMLGEIGGPCNYDNMVKCFEAKMSGFINDPDDLVVSAFKSYNEEVSETVKNVTTIKNIMDTANFKYLLMNLGDKMSQEEIDDMFEEFELDDDGQILTKSVVDLFVAGGMDEKKEEEKKEDKKAVEASPDADAGAGGDSAKKKKKKKKAAK